MSENQALVHKNTILGVTGIEKDNLESFYKQKPNKKLLGIGFLKTNLSIYNALNWKRDNRVVRALRNTFGEPPVIFDTSLATFSAQQMQLYLYNKGYFDAQTTQHSYIKKKKAYITYQINKGEHYKIRNIQYKITDTIIRSIYFLNLDKSVIKIGDYFDQDKIAEERERITSDIKNLGYYFFNREYLHFDIDSSIKGNLIDLYVVIENPTGKKNHQAYTINNIDVNIQSDETYRAFSSRKKVEDPSININDPKNLIKSKIIKRLIFIEKDKKYADKNVELTYNRLGDLRIFKFVNIDFAIDSLDSTKINSIITLSAGKKQGTQTEIEGYVASANLGSSANFIYTNKNIFRGAEIFEFRIKAGLETQAFIDESQSSGLIFNSRESNTSASITFPGFLLFRDKKIYGLYASPKTRLGINYITENRPEYNRNTFVGSMTYDWKQNQFITHSFSPMSINFVRSTLSSEALDLLNNLNNKYIKESFDPHITLGLRYALVYSNQIINLRKDYFYLRFNIEVMGTGLYMSSKLLNNPINSSGAYEYFNLPYYNFTRPEIDVRYFNFVHNKSMLVYRFNAGAGYAYWNSKVLPFERQFFTGGSNSIRAFRARSVGPGKFSDVAASTLNLDQTGEMKIEANVEYRFDLTDNFLGSKLKGATFLDMGNVWTISSENTNDAGKFYWDKFYNQFAVGTGFGLRLDYSFLLFRFDVGLKLRDPRFTGSDQWVIQKISNKTWTDANQYNFWNFNFGIGYPF